MSARRWLLTILSFGAAIGVSVYIVASSWPEEHAPLLPVSAHALAMLAAAIDMLARGAKIRYSGHALGMPLSLRTGLRTSLGGDFGAGITPARSGAEPARFLILAERGIPITNVLLLLFVELFLEMLSLAIVAIILAITFRDAGKMISGMIGLVFGYAGVVLGAGGVALMLSRHNAHGPPPAWALRIGLHAGRWRAVQRLLRQVKHGVSRLRGAAPVPALVALACSTLHVIARLAVLPALVLAADPAVPLAPLTLWPLVLFYGGVVAPVPAGGGVIEFAFKATLGHVIPKRIFGATLIWWRFYTFYVNIALGALIAGGTVMRALRERGKPKHEAHRHRVTALP
ncbi:MAG: flippase-like domain-containing protein [Gemmatimonadota bacterium]|nr:flippase-like domain-containing protein [Gemmatimonadota bacterium]